MELTHTIRIAAPVDRVFAFVADARNDPRWCPRVEWCRLVAGEDPAAVGTRYEALQHPSLRRTQRRWIEVVASDPPRRIVTSQVDEQGEFAIEYVLQESDGGTLLTQRDEVAWKVPRPAVPIAERIVRRHIRSQLEGLKRVLEERR